MKRKTEKQKKKSDDQIKSKQKATCVDQSGAISPAILWRRLFMMAPQGEREGEWGHIGAFAWKKLEIKILKAFKQKPKYDVDDRGQPSKSQVAKVAKKSRR